MAIGRPDGEGTTIGTHVKLSGVLSDPNDIIILGKLDGEVQSNRTVVVGEQAQIKGPILAGRAIVSGLVRGNINAKERIEILPKGNVTGNLETRDLVIHSGAIFNGRSAMIGEVKAEAEEEAPAPSLEVPSTPPPPQDEPPPEKPTEPAKGRRLWPPIRLAFPRQKPKEADKSDESSKDKASPDEPNEKPTYEVE